MECPDISEVLVYCTLVKYDGLYSYGNTRHDYSCMMRLESVLETTRV